MPVLSAAAPRRALLVLLLLPFALPLAAQGRAPKGGARPQGAPLGVTAPQACWRYLGSRRALSAVEQQQVLRELTLVRPVCPVLGYSWGPRARPTFLAYDRDRLEVLHGYTWPGMASQWSFWRQVYLTDLLSPDPWGRPINGDSLSRFTIGWGILPASPRLSAFVRQHVTWADGVGRLDWPTVARHGPWLPW